MVQVIDNIENNESKELVSLLEQVAQNGASTVLGSDNFEITVFITDKEEIKEINREHRGIDKETDVLSFPLWDRRNGEEPFKNPETDNIMLGDIIICLSKLQEQAEEYGHSQKREGAYLCIHGVLHLLGYDHIEEEDKKEMRLKEEELLTALKITRED